MTKKLALGRLRVMAAMVYCGLLVVYASTAAYGAPPPAQAATGRVISEKPQTDDAGNRYLSVVIYVPELYDSVSYEAYQNGKAAEALVEECLEEGEVDDVSQKLSTTIKKYMRERNIRVMLCDDFDYGIIRTARPESFVLVSFDPLLFPGDLPLDYGVDLRNFDVGPPPF